MECLQHSLSYWDALELIDDPDQLVDRTLPIFQTGGSYSVVLGLGLTWEVVGNAVPRPHPDPQSLGLGPALCCSEASRGWLGSPKFKDHSSGPSMGPRLPQASASKLDG